MSTIVHLADAKTRAMGPLCGEKYVEGMKVWALAGLKPARVYIGSMRITVPVGSLDVLEGDGQYQSCPKCVEEVRNLGGEV